MTRITEPDRLITVPPDAARAARPRGACRTARPRRAARHVASWLALACVAVGALVASLVDTGSLLAARCYAEPPAAAATTDGDEPFTVIKARKVVTISGKEIEGGMIVLAGGKIHSVGPDLEYPLNARVIDLHDCVVMPGLINPHSRYGLGPVRRDGVHGHVGVADEYYPPPGVYDDLLDSGYTTLGLVPDGTGLPGRMLVVRIAGPEDQRRLTCPGYLRFTGDKPALRGALDKAQQEIDKVTKAREEWDKKQAEQKPAEEPKKEPPPKTAQTADEKPAPPASQPATQPATQPAFEPPPIDPAYQPLVDLLQKKEGPRLLLEFRRSAEFLHFCDVLKKHEVAHDFFVSNPSSTDLQYVMETLAERKPRILMLPVVNRILASAERIHVVRMASEAGCEVSLMPLNDSPEECRRLLGRVAELVQAGWSRDAALRAVTLHPARLLGLDKRLGTIEVGKDADLIFLDADPLDPTARVRAVMIAGEIVHRVEDSQ